MGTGRGRGPRGRLRVTKRMPAIRGQQWCQAWRPSQTEQEAHCPADFWVRTFRCDGGCRCCPRREEQRGFRTAGTSNFGVQGHSWASSARSWLKRAAGQSGGGRWGVRRQGPGLAKNNMRGGQALQATGIGVGTQKGDAGSSATALCCERRTLLEGSGLPCPTARLHKCTASLTASLLTGSVRERERGWARTMPDWAVPNARSNLANKQRGCWSLRGLVRDKLRDKLTQALGNGGRPPFPAPRWALGSSGAWSTSRLHLGPVLLLGTEKGRAKCSLCPSEAPEISPFQPSPAGGSPDAPPIKHPVAESLAPLWPRPAPATVSGRENQRNKSLVEGGCRAICDVTASDETSGKWRLLADDVDDSEGAPAV
jgi:hypothetical protein